MAEGHGGSRPGSGRWSKDELEALKRGDSDDLISRISGRSFASIQTKRAALKVKRKRKEGTTVKPEKVAAEPKKKREGLSEMMLERIVRASAEMKRKQRFRPEFNPFKPAEHPPVATPPKKFQMAMDQFGGSGGLGWASNNWGNGVGAFLGAMESEALFFLGYPFLSELAQRSEYRVISETIADDATRKWIDFEVTGEEEEKEPSTDDPAEMREAGGEPGGLAGDKSPEAVAAEEKLDGQARGFKDEDPDERKKKIESAGKMDKVKALKDEMARLELRDKFYGVARDDGFFGRSHLFMDFGVDLDDMRGELGTDIGDSRDPTSQKKIEKGSLKRLKVIEPVWIYPTTYNAQNPLAEDWYNPQVWYVMGKNVHVSRMPVFIGHPVPDMLKPAYSFGGLSLSQLAKPYVDIWLKTRESIGELIHAFSVMVLMTDMQTVLQGGSIDTLMTRVAAFNAFRDNQGTFVLNKATEEFKNVSASLSGLHELQAQAQEHMASVSRIPLVKLTGISPSGLNASSEGEIRAYYDTISAYQNRFFRPNLTKVINFIQLSLWGEIDPEITFEFEPLWELSNKEKSEKEKDDAERDQKYVDMGAFSPGEIRKIKIDDPTLPYTDMDPEEVPDLRAEEEQGLEPEGGRPQPLAEAGPELGGGGIEETGPGQDESPSVRRAGLAWGDQYEWMRGYNLPTARKDGAVIVKEAPQGSMAREKGLRIGSRVRYELADRGGTGRIFGFVPNGSGVNSVAVLDTDSDRVVFPHEEMVSTRPVTAEDERRGGGQDAVTLPFLDADEAKKNADVVASLSTPVWRDKLKERLVEINRSDAEDEFREEDHPRRDDGKFGSGSGASTSGLSSEGGSKKTANAASLYKAPTKTADHIVAEFPGGAEAIHKTRQRLSKTISTDKPIREGGHKKPDGTYTPERQAVHKKILDEIFTPEAIAAALPAEGEKPVLTMLGGRGGSGKSWLTNQEKGGPVDGSKALLLDSDHIKGRLPGYEGWNAAMFHEESTDILNMADDRAIALGIHAIHDATLKSEITPALRMSLYVAAGYEVEGYYMYLSPQDATTRALKRFSKGGTFTGRFVPPEVVLANTDNEKNFDKLSANMRKWAVYDNSGTAPKLVSTSDE